MTKISFSFLKNTSILIVAAFLAAFTSANASVSSAGDHTMVTCTVFMVDLMPIKPGTKLPNEWHCVDASTNKSYLLISPPCELIKMARRGGRPQVSIPTSRLRNDDTDIIDLNSDLASVKIHAEKRNAVPNARLTGTKSVVIIRVTSADGQPTKTAAELSDDILGTSGDVLNLVRCNSS